LTLRADHDTSYVQFDEELLYVGSVFVCTGSPLLGWLNKTRHVDRRALTWTDYDPLTSYDRLLNEYLVPARPVYEFSVVSLPPFLL
jgi:hypothetical protein